MTPDQLHLWREEMKLTHRAAAAALGISLPTYQQMERGLSWKTDKPVLISKSMALACAAIRAGIAPEGG